MSNSLLGRSITVLEAVVEAGEPIGPRSLSRSTGIDRSAVGRILKQLLAQEILTSKDGRYSPGPRLFTIGRMLSVLDTLPAAATAALTSLVDSFNETSYVGVLQNSSIVFVYEKQSSRALRYVVELGRPAPLHAGAGGRAILSGLPESAAIRLLGAAPLEALTKTTVLSLDKVLDLRLVDRERGYSMSREERVEGGSAVAAPIFDESGNCQGSVVLTSPVSRFENYDHEELGGAVIEAAKAISSRLGPGTHIRSMA